MEICYLSLSSLSLSLSLSLSHSDGDETYLSDVVECYSHLIHCLPDVRKYLQSVSRLVLEENRRGRSLAQYVCWNHRSLQCKVLACTYIKL